MDTQQQIEQLKKELFNELQEAHYQAGKNNPSISRQVFLASMEGSGDVTQAICSALLTTGGMHGPLVATREALAAFIADPDEVSRQFEQRIRSGVKIPGLGNSFFKDHVDPAFQRCVDLYTDLWHAFKAAGAEDYEAPMFRYVESVNLLISRFKEKSVWLYPNAALITAAVCELLNTYPLSEVWFFASARSRAWIELYTEQQQNSVN